MFTLQRFIMLLLGGLVFFLSACSTVICSTPEVLVDGSCCYDYNEDGSCDSKEELLEHSGKPQQTISHAIEGSEVPLSTNETVPEEVLAQQKPIELDLSSEEVYFFGNEQATKTLKVYGSYQDTFTRKFSNDVLPHILDSYGEHIRIEFKDLPKTQHKYGQMAAEASNCAGEQGRYKDYHNKLFSVNSFTESDFYIFATELELNKYEFIKCLKSHRYLDEVLADREEATKDNVNIIPSFVIENKRITGLRQLSYFEEVLDETLGDALTQSYIKKILLSVTGDGHIILPGSAELDSFVQDSPYTNNLDFMNGKLFLKGEDIISQDSISSPDHATAEIIFTLPLVGTGEDIYTITLENLHTVAPSGKSYQGGIATNIDAFGITGKGTHLLPQTYAYVYLWGKANVFRNGGLVDENVTMEIYAIHGVRSAGKLSIPDPSDIELYLHLPGKYATPAEAITAFPEESLYLFWEEGVNLKVV